VSGKIGYQIASAWSLSLDAVVYCFWSKLLALNSGKPCNYLEGIRRFVLADLFDF